MTESGRHRGDPATGTADDDAFEGLVRQMSDVWNRAVDELDVSVSLEAAGINDSVASGRYGTRDVHDLAERLLERVPAAVSESDRPAPAARIAYLRLACRGLLFGIPGLFYIVIARAAPTATTSYTLVASMLAAWGLSQTVAVVAYRVYGRGGRRSASIALGRMMVGSLVCGAVAMAAFAVTGVTVFGAQAVGQVLYVLAATVLLFYDADRLLAAALVPGAAVSALFLGGTPMPIGVAVAAVTTTVVLAMSAAWLAIHIASKGSGPVDRPRLSDALHSWPFVLNGVVTGLTIAYMPLMSISGHAGKGLHSLDLTIIPLVLSMGFAEIELLRLRHSGGHLMRRSAQMADYRAGAVRMVARSQLRFLAVLLAVSLVVGGVIHLATGFDTRDLVLLTSYSILGTALLAGLILVALNRVWTASAGYLAAGLCFGGLVLAHRALDVGFGVAEGYLVLCVLLLGSLSVCAYRTLRDPFALA